MSHVVEVTPEPGATPGAPEHHRPPRPGGTWTLRRHGVRTVVELELRQRVRSTRWRVALGAWFVVCVLVTWLTFRTSAQLVGPDYAGYSADGTDAFSSELEMTFHVPRGPLIFGLIVFFVMLAGFLVAPTLSAGAINGDRDAGTLATLQVTLLSPAEIAVGKLLAGWTAAVAFLVVALPFVVVSLAAGGVRVVSLAVTLVLLVVLLGVVCAIGLGFSALVSRTTASALLTYLTVLALTVGTVVLFGLTFPLITQTDEVRVNDYTADASCTWSTQSETRSHTERTWWLLAANPFVVVADAAPSAPGAARYGVPDPLQAIRSGVREARSGPADREDWCGDGADAGVQPGSTAPVWPWGLGADLLLGAGAVWLTVRRLRIPQGALPRGTRVA
ncbi:ABC transporter permease [Luteimicrobium sp. NPDC057192]|uniref:ABC transporter permease n=1 Tax=Luteimicrobium sp. NPDC057192 TaxID=3346042 RepID=UPI003634BFD1